MSYQTIYECTQDRALQDRVTAAGMKEAFAGGDEYKNSEFGRQLRTNPALALNTFMWPTAVDYETEYAYAVDVGNPNPGGDVGVISDANLQAVVQAYWPAEPVYEPQVPIFPDPISEPDPPPEAPDGD